MKSPLTLEPLFHLGPVAVTEPVVVSWAIIALLGLGSALATRRLAVLPSRGQALIELVVSTIDAQIRGTMQTDPAPFRRFLDSGLHQALSVCLTLRPSVEIAVLG